MKIGFVYNAPCNILKIIQNPVDDATEAVCQLAINLAKLGHDITIFSRDSINATEQNVRCRPMDIKDQALILDPALLEQDFEILIFKNESADFAISVKGVLPYKPKIYLWTTYSNTAKVNQSLGNTNIVDQLEGIICASLWQRNLLIDGLFLPANKIVAIKYGISPLFQDLFTDAKEFMQVKAHSPQLVYIAKPEDGLSILLDSFYDISNIHADTILNIFCKIDDPKLLQRVKNTQGVNYVGAVPKKELAAMLRTPTILANPSILPCTLNLGLLNALAAGLYPVSSNFSANSDYCRGHGKLIDVGLLESSSLDNFTSEMLTVCQAQMHYASDFYDYCFKQVLAINKKQTWAIRANEWQAFLSGKEAAGNNADP